MNVLDDEGFAPPPTPTGTCDKCGPAVRAYLFARVNGVELGYCRSCGNRYFEKLVQVGTVIIDMRHVVEDEESARRSGVSR